MARSPRPPRLLPSPFVLGQEPDAFNPMSQQDEEGLATLVYISGATVGVGDSNTQTSSFIATMNNSIFAGYMNNALGL